MQETIRVIHIADKFGVKGSSVHGVSRLFSWWLPRFDRSRFDVRLIGLRPHSQAAENLSKHGVDVTSLGRSKYDIGTLPDLLKIIRSEQPDILHLHGYGSTNFGRMASAMTGVKTIVHEHFVDPAMPAFQGPIDRALARFTDFGIAVSNSVREFMIRKRHLPANKVDVVFNGAPLHEFKPMSADHVQVERCLWNIPDGFQVVASIGRLDEQKGNRYLIDAAAQIINEAGYPVYFLIVGDGPLLNTLKEQAQERGIGERVIFTGYLSDIPRIQSIVDVQVFPSLWEGTPLTLFEAMSMARAIVSTDVDGLGEVLVDGQNARLAPPRSPEKLAEAILHLLETPEEARRLAAQAQLDSQQYSIQHTVDRMQQIYQKLIGVAEVSTSRAY